MSQTPESVHHHIRVSFDLDVEYRMDMVSDADAELVALRDLLLQNPRVFQKMLVNKCLSELEFHLGAMQTQGGLLGYDGKDLIYSLARTLPRANVLTLLGYDMSGAIYTDLITHDSFDPWVTAMHAVDLDQGQEINLDPPTRRLVVSKANQRYQIAQTETEALIVLRGSYYSDLPYGGLEHTLVSIDRAMAESRELGLHVSAMECNIDAVNSEQIESARDTIGAYCQERYPALQVTYIWSKVAAYSTPQAAWFKASGT